MCRIVRGLKLYRLIKLLDSAADHRLYQYTSSSRHGLDPVSLQVYVLPASLWYHGCLKPFGLERIPAMHINNQ